MLGGAAASRDDKAPYSTYPRGGHRRINARVGRPRRETYQQLVSSSGVGSDVKKARRSLSGGSAKCRATGAFVDPSCKLAPSISSSRRGISAASSRLTLRGLRTATFSVKLSYARKRVSRGDEIVDAHISVAPSAITLLGLRLVKFLQPGGLKCQLLGFIWSLGTGKSIISPPAAPTVIPSVSRMSYKALSRMALFNHPTNRVRFPVAPGLSHVGIVPDNVSGRRVFSVASRFPPPLNTCAAPYSPHSILIVSQNPVLAAQISPPYSCASTSRSYHAQSKEGDKSGHFHVVNDLLILKYFSGLVGVGELGIGRRGGSEVSPTVIATGTPIAVNIYEVGRNRSPFPYALAIPLPRLQLVE
ncbi:hypothetical protein PR048_001178 [Dryococelus australis]|uniref:Uncharacterized protein n=1 Tax=Dryococelus australis TaxID=614101 RepID=A0ABQ9IHZ4_9NEOP|nr:hypothetical protein PR048_001178 [Dryococelus australis]